MNILYISSEYPPDTGWGGIATYTHTIAQAMAARGHTVHVICRSLDGFAAIVHDGQVTIHRIAAGTYPLPQGRRYYLLRNICYRLIPHTLVMLAWSFAAYNCLKKLENNGLVFDCVECPDCSAEGYAIASKSNLPLIVRLHTPWTMVRSLDDLQEPVVDRLAIAFFEKKTLQKAARLTAPSQAMAIAVKKLWGISGVDVFPNPINIEPIQISGQRPYWIYTGRIEYRKGVHLLLNAYAQVSKAVKVPRLLLIGRPYGTARGGSSYGDYIETLITSLNLGDSVEWIKGIDREALLQKLLQSSVAIFPSLWENYPYTCLEAMLAKCTVVAADCGGFPEMIINNQTGLLFKAGDQSDLARVLGRCLDASIDANMGASAHAWVRSHADCRLIAEKTESLYLKSITKP